MKLGFILGSGSILGLGLGLRLSKVRVRDEVRVHFRIRVHFRVRVRFRDECYPATSAPERLPNSTGYVTHQDALYVLRVRVRFRSSV